MVLYYLTVSAVIYLYIFKLISFPAPIVIRTKFGRETTRSVMIWDISFSFCCLWQWCWTFLRKNERSFRIFYADQAFVPPSIYMSVHLSACPSVSIISYLFAFCRRKAEALLNMLKTNRKEGRKNRKKEAKDTTKRKCQKQNVCFF